MHTYNSWFCTVEGTVLTVLALWFVLGVIYWFFSVCTSLESIAESQEKIAEEKKPSTNRNK